MKSDVFVAPGAPFSKKTRQDDIFVRPLAAGEAQKASQIEKLTLSTFWTEKDISSFMHNPNALYLAAFIQDEMAGVCGCLYGAGEGQLINLAVLPRHRRKGVAAALMAHLTAKLKTLECDRLFLEVGENNVPGLLFYQKMGFTVLSRRKNYYQNENALNMALKLSNQF